MTLAVRYYLCSVSGSGTGADPYRPRLAEMIPALSWAAADGRADPASASGQMLAWADVTPAQHAALAADPGVTYVPFADAGGNPLPLDATVGDLAVANRTAISTALENRGVPTDDFTPATPLRQVVVRVLRRFVVRQLLSGSDFPQGLDTLVSAVPAAQRQAISARLKALGFDTAVIQLTDTVRQALKKLFTQATTYLQTHLG